MRGAGVADCERRDEWFAAQDVNAWSSLAYVAVALVIVVVVGRRARPRRFLAFGAVVALEGVGSALFHGTGGDTAQLLHDGPLLGALGFIAGWHVGRLSDRAEVGALAGLAAGVAAGLITAIGGGSDVVAALLVVVTAGAELVARRRGRPAVWTTPLLALLVVAAIAWLAGTSSSPLCDAGSWAQPHGAWHVLSALVLLGWFVTATSPSD